MTDQKIALPPVLDNVSKQFPQQEERSSAGDCFYEIKVEGFLDEGWSEWLSGLKIAHEGGGCTLLAGVVPDQAALHGLLVKIRDLGLPLLSLKRVKNNGAD
jgi:hypothetical protein